MVPLQIRKSKSDFNVNASKCELWLKEKYLYQYRKNKVAGNYLSAFF
jgi:hypothetical protein